MAYQNRRGGGGGGLGALPGWARRGAMEQQAQLQTQQQAQGHQPHLRSGLGDGRQAAPATQTRGRALPPRTLPPVDDDSKEYSYEEYNFSRQQHETTRPLSDEGNSLESPERSQGAAVESPAPEGFVPLFTSTPVRQTDFSYYVDYDTDETGSMEDSIQQTPRQRTPVSDASSALADQPSTIVDERTYYPASPTFAGTSSDTVDEGTASQSLDSNSRSTQSRGGRRPAAHTGVRRVLDFTGSESSGVASYSGLDSVPEKYKIVPKYIILAYQENEKLFWQFLQVFYTYGLWPDIDTLPDAFQNLCKSYGVTDDDVVEMPPLGPSWIRHLIREGDPFFNDIIRYIFDTGQQPYWDHILEPHYIDIFESMGIGEWDFTDEGYADLDD